MAKSEKRETAAEAREAVTLHKQMTSVNTGSLEERLLRIGLGEPVAPQGSDEHSGGEGSFIDVAADSGTAEASHIDFESVFSKLASQNPGMLKKATKPPMTKIATARKPPVDFGDLTPVIKDIATFKYSSNREKEIGAIRQAVQKEIQTIVSQRVVSNTKEVSANIHQFYRIKDGGMRVEFSLLNQKYSFAALGEFMGNEYLCWQVSGNDINGHVMRMDDEGEFYDASEDFKVQITQGWKE